MEVEERRETLYESSSLWLGNSTKGFRLPKAVEYQAFSVVALPQVTTTAPRDDFLLIFVTVLRCFHVLVLGPMSLSSCGYVHSEVR